MRIRPASLPFGCLLWRDHPPVGSLFYRGVMTGFFVWRASPAISRRLSAAAAACLLPALALAGCAAPPPPATPPASAPSSAGPAFASDEEALTIATDAYAAYLAMRDLILSEMGANPLRIGSVATAQAKESFKSDAADFADEEIRIVGSTKFDSVVLQGWSETGKVTIYVCNDVSQTDLIGPDGASRVTQDRNPRSPWQIVVEVRSPSDSFVEARTLWAGENFC